MKWISVKDSLPEDEQHVIGFCSTGNNPVLHVEPLLYQTYVKGDPSWAYLFAYNEGYDYATRVTHWMPLPDAPIDFGPGGDDRKPGDGE